MNIYEALITGAGASQDTAPGLAQALRDRRALGTLAQLSGDKVLAPYGAGQLKTVEDQTERFGSQSLVRARQKAEQERHEANLALNTRRVDLEERRIGQAKELAELAARSRLAAAEIGRGGKALPTHYADALRSAGEEVKAVKSLRTNMPENVGSEGLFPGVSTAQVWAANNYGIGSDETITKARWWADFEQKWNIVRRNEKFGATLTPHEKAAWKSATINPEMSGSEIGLRMGIMEKWAQWRLKNEVGAASASGRYDETEIRALADLDALTDEDESAGEDAIDEGQNPTKRRVYTEGQGWGE